MFNAFNFGCDLMEPFRPLVDRQVVSLAPAEFTKEHKLALIDTLNHKVLIDSREQYVNNAIRIYCKSIFDALNQKDISLVRFYRNEL